MIVLIWTNSQSKSSSPRLCKYLNACTVPNWISNMVLYAEICLPPFALVPFLVYESWFGQNAVKKSFKGFISNSNEFFFLYLKKRFEKKQLFFSNHFPFEGNMTSTKLMNSLYPFIMNIYFASVQKLRRNILKGYRKTDMHKTI